MGHPECSGFVLFCFVWFGAGAERQAWSAVRWRAECGCDDRWNVAAMTGGMRLRGRWNVIARQVGCSCAHT